MAVKPVPQGYHTVTSTMVIDGCGEALEVYKRAFGGEELSRALGPGGKVMHAELKIGDSIIMVADVIPGMGEKTRTSLWLYVPDVDAAYKRAAAAGLTSTVPVSDQFWGDRFGQLEDRWGNKWSLATHTEDVSKEEMDRRQAEFMKKMGPPA